MNISKSNHTILHEPQMIISNNCNPFISESILKVLTCFFSELKLCFSKNEAHDFGEWFNEQTFLCIMLNGLIRSDKRGEITTLMEYSTTNSKRCDALININRDAFVIEAKMHRYFSPVTADHFEIEPWIKWDEFNIRQQLINYYTIDETYYTNLENYDSCYLMTTVFKNIKENVTRHLKLAEERINPEHQNSFGRMWYYSNTFLDYSDISSSVCGVEVYGTIEKKYPILP